MTVIELALLLPDTRDCSCCHQIFEYGQLFRVEETDEYLCEECLPRKTCSHLKPPPTDEQVKKVLDEALPEMQYQPEHGLRYVDSMPPPTFGFNTSLYEDRVVGKYFLRVSVPDWQGDMNILTCFKNLPPCGLKMSRPHECCFHCQYKAVHDGKKPEFIPVRLFTIAIQENRSHAAWKDSLIKILVQGIEQLSV